MKRRSLFVLLTVMALIAAACSGGDDGSSDPSDSGGGSGEPVQITLWHGYASPACVTASRTTRPTRCSS